MNRTIKTVFVGVALLVGAVAPAAAQGRVGVSLEKRGRERAIKVDVGLGVRPILRPRAHVHTDCCRRWVPPRCETITDKVWIEARCERTWVPPAYDIVIDACGRSQRVCIREGYWNVIQHPGRWECVTRTVHIPGRWETTCGR